MDTQTLITKVCIFPPKRLIHVVIFVLIGLKCYQTEDPFKKRCWVTRPNYRYHGLVGNRIEQLQECKDYCEHVLRNCDMVSFDVPSTTSKCASKNFSTPLDASKFESKDQINLYFLDLDCARNVPSCWTVKGDFDFRGLERYDKRNVTVEECKQICLNDTSICDVITYTPYASGGPACFTRTQAGSLDKFFAKQGVISYVLNTTCQQAKSTVSQTDESSSGKLVMIILGVLILISVLVGAGIFGLSKKSKSKPAKGYTPAPQGSAPTAAATSAPRKAKINFEDISISSR